MKYNKLVRDRIPEIIKRKGEDPIFHTADEEEYWIKLKEKLKEEVEEFIKDENEEELADIMEVIDAICFYKKFKYSKILEIKIKKLKEKGGFNERFILDES